LEGDSGHAVKVPVVEGSIGRKKKSKERGAYRWRIGGKMELNKGGAKPGGGKRRPVGHPKKKPTSSR